MYEWQLEQSWTTGAFASSCKFSALDLHECLAWPHPHRLEPVSFSLCLIHYSPLLLFSLSHVSHAFFRMYMHENAKGPHLFLLTQWPLLYLCLFMCTILLFGSWSQWRHIQACLTLRPTWGLKQHSFSLLSVYQHNAAHWDKWRQLLQDRKGVFQGLDYQHFYEAFSFPLWCIVLLRPLAASSRASTHHTRLRISDCIMSAALVSGQYAEPRL